MTKKTSRERKEEHYFNRAVIAIDAVLPPFKDKDGRQGQYSCKGDILIGVFMIRSSKVVSASENKAMCCWLFYIEDKNCCCCSWSYVKFERLKDTESQ